MEIRRIHYRDMNGELLRSFPMNFSHLHSVGQDVTIDGICWIIRRVAIVNTVQHINMELA